MENMNRLNRMTVTEEQLKLLYEACVREKKPLVWDGAASRSRREKATDVFNGGTDESIRRPYKGDWRSGNP